jgi:cleavage and polyadenylation specificity factor subunit 1
VNGSDNPVADALSRANIQAVHQVPPQIDFSAMAAAQSTDCEFQQLKDTSTTLNFVTVPIEGTDLTLICDVSTGKQRPYVPLNFRYSVFDHLHSLSHPGIGATQHLLTSHYVWPRINADVR